jgi:serine/threonine protein kinase
MPHLRKIVDIITNKMGDVPIINKPPSITGDVINPRIMKTSRRYMILHDSASQPISKMFMFDLFNKNGIVKEVHRFIRELAMRKILFDNSIVEIDTVDYVIRGNAAIGYVNLKRYEHNLYEFMQLGEKLSLEVASKLISSMIVICAEFEVVGIVHRSLTPAEIMINTERNELGEIIDIEVAICDFEDSFLSKINPGNEVFDTPDTPFYNLFSYGKEIINNNNNNILFWQKYTGYAMAKCIQYVMQGFTPVIINEIHSKIIPRLNELSNINYQDRLTFADFLYSRGINSIDIANFNDPLELIEAVRHLELSYVSPPSTKNAASIIIDALTGTNREVPIDFDTICEIIRIIA